MLKKYKIFLASSSTLKEYREKLTIEIASKDKIWSQKGILLELVIWEDLDNSMQLTRSQDEYNRQIAKCDAFVLLASKTLGKYSKEEFDVAYTLFKNRAIPKIYTFFDETKEMDENLKEFIKFYEEKEHFISYYTTFEDFWNKLYYQLEKELSKVEKTLPQIKDNIDKKIGLIPPNIEDNKFKGRKGILADIYKSFFEDEERVYLLHGEGGIGKTAIAIKYYHTYEDKYSHLIWSVDIDGIDNAILNLAGDLDINLQNKKSKDEKIIKVLKEIEKLNKPILFVIDNIEDKEHLFQSHHHLKRTDNIHFLLTSRPPFEDFKSKQITKLKESEAKELFKHYYNYSKDEEIILDEILKAVGYNTLVIEVLAKNLKATKARGYTLEKLLKDLQNEGILNIKKQRVIEGITYKELKKAKAEDVVNAMYNLSKLNENELKLLSLFSLFPEIKISYENIIYLTKIKEDTLDEILDSLENRAWLLLEEDSYKINAIIADIIRKKRKEQIKKDYIPLLEALNKALDYEPITGKLKDETIGFALLPIAESVAKILFNKGIKNKELSILFERVINYNKRYGNVDSALEYFEEATEFFEELYNKNPKSIDLKYDLAITYLKLGDTYQAILNMNKALEYFNETVKLFEELYNTNPKSIDLKNGLAISYSKLGGIYQYLGDTKKALEYFEEDLKLTKELYNANPNSIDLKRGLAISYSKLGDIYLSLGNIQKALKYLQNAHKLFKELAWRVSGICRMI